MGAEFIGELIVALLITAAVGAILDHRKSRWTGRRTRHGR